ncbi:MAG TPA: ABC transporter substrate-binding protein [Burkholderiales bacterium]|nr:ABC transporter substrate-binding protein [Burkholderiales bacterium]
MTQALKTAIGNYGITRALKDGGVRGGPPLSQIEVSPITAAMRRMVRTLEFDVCEMAFTTYLCAVALGKPILAIPVFVTRNFHHWALFKNAKAGIESPKDLEGRVVGVNRGYTVTTGLWARGMLRDEYGVDLERITWAPTDDEHVAEYKAPANVDYSFRGRPLPDLLASGEIGAAIGDIRSDSPDIKPLVPDARNAGFEYYRRTGVYPINHGIVVRTDLLRANPGLARELFEAFKASKSAYLARLREGRDLSPADQNALDLGRVVGGDPFPFGVRANRPALETMVRFAVEQHVIPKPIPVEDLFSPETLALE